jgi:hypothetical protein
VLVVAGAVLASGSHKSSKAIEKPVATPSPTPSQLSADELTRKANAALLQTRDLPGSDTAKPVTPDDVILPCNRPNLSVRQGSVLRATSLEANDSSVFTSEAVIGLPTMQDTTDTFNRIRGVFEGCQPYDFHYDNSTNVDRVTYTDVDYAFGVGDDSVYIKEVDTPKNYSGDVTTYSYAYMRYKQFLVRITYRGREGADKDAVRELMNQVTDRLNNG